MHKDSPKFAAKLSRFGDDKRHLWGSSSTHLCMYVYIYISPADWDLMGSNLDKFLVYGF
jgi:hypothetical protein